MKWGIMATGKIAANFAKTVRAMASPDEELIAVGSRNMESAGRFAAEYDIPVCYGSYEDLAGDPQVEAVYIATPNHLHYENCLLCLEAGKHVLCEKPLTTDAGLASSLYGLAEKKGLFLMEAFWIRFLPLYEKLGALLSDGSLGAVRHVRAEYGFIAEGARRTRKFRSELGGGALLDIGIYNLGFLYFVTGLIPTAFSSHVHMNEFGTDDYSTLQLEYADGATAHSLQTIGLQVPRRAAIICEKGMICLEDFQCAEKMTVHLTGKEPYEISCPFEINGYEYEIRETTACIRAGKCRSDRFTPEDSLKVLQLMDDIRQSWGMKFAFEA